LARLTGGDVILGLPKQSGNEDEHEGEEDASAAENSGTTS
jgi:hypothetical protein